MVYKSREDIEVSDTLSYTALGRIEKDSIYIERDCDLDGRSCILPKGFTLYIIGGKLRNGIIKGNDTKIAGKGTLFDRVTIKGTWNVSEISSSLFEHLEEENALCNVFALASPKIQNKIVIEKGEYQVKALKNGDTCLQLCSNTELVLDGVIRLAPNDFKKYDISLVMGENITITGKGKIIGDKHTHSGSKGEWGIGIRFHGAKNASVKELTIRDCWGDCIYVGGNSKNISIENCLLDHGRRQGISITKADGVTIRHCKITNVGGTNPQYAIDIEPNKGNTVDNVIIDNVEVKDCEGGFLATRSMAKKDGKPISWIGKVEVRNCKVMVNSKAPMRFKGCESLTVEKCQVEGSNHRSVISTDGVKHVTVKNNTIRLDVQNLATMKNFAKKAVGQGDYRPISIKGADSKVVKNNRILEE